MISNLVVLVIVHAFDDINLSGLQTIVRTGGVGPGNAVLTFGHWPFPRSLSQVFSASSLMFAYIYAHTNMRAKWLDTSVEDWTAPKDNEVTHHNPTGLYRDPG